MTSDPHREDGAGLNVEASRVSWEVGAKSTRAQLRGEWGRSGGPNEQVRKGQTLPKNLVFKYEQNLPVWLMEFPSVF